MALFGDDDLPRKTAVHEMGQDLSLLSVTELDERMVILSEEMARLKLARDSKQASKFAADTFFRKG